jgi:hypothetical protein
MGRDKFFGLLKEEGLLVSRKRSSTRTTNSYHRFHTYGNMVKDMRITPPQSGVGIGYHVHTDTRRVRLFIVIDGLVLPQDSGVSFIAGFGDIGMFTGLTRRYQVVSPSGGYRSSFR